MNTHIPDWCVENLSIKNGLTRGYIGESNETIIQLITTSGAFYQTSMSDEHTFQSLVKQINGDKLTEIRYSDLTILGWIRNSKNIWEWIKSRVALSLHSLR